MHRKTRLLRNAAFAALAPAIAVFAVPAHADITGFGTNGAGYTLNGGPTVAGDVLTLTDNVGSQAHSAFFNTAQPITSGGFTASFTYTNLTGDGADGIAFVLQNDARGAAALGDAGGSLGFGAGDGASNNGIKSSSGFELNLYGDSAAAYRTQNASGSYSANTFTAPVSTGIANTPINVTLTYDGATTLTANLVQGMSTFSKTYTVTPRQLADGSNSVFVGFTGGTGGAQAAQTISNFTFTTTGSQVTGLVTDVTKPGDSITPVGNAWNEPNEGIHQLIDDQGNTKGLNFESASGTYVPQGVVITPSAGSSLVTGLALMTANDAPERDPSSYILEGSNDGGATWALISSGAITNTTDRLSQFETTFANSASYLSYRLLFPTIVGVNNLDIANSIQISEIELLGSPTSVPEPASLSLLGLGAMGLLGRRRRKA